jgi:hypothetical protein
MTDPKELLLSNRMKNLRSGRTGDEVLRLYNPISIPNTPIEND